MRPFCCGYTNTQKNATTGIRRSTNTSDLLVAWLLLPMNGFIFVLSMVIMKQSITFCLIVATLILFGSCSKKNNNTSFNATMTATVGANSFTSTSTGAVQGTIGGVNDLTITGKSSSILIAIDVWGYNNATGSFPISTTMTSGTSTASYNPGSTLSTQVNAVHGNVTITSTSGGVITGTFNFVASDSTTVSGGNFSVKTL
jgi:hypothetical protein